MLTLGQKPPDIGKKNSASIVDKLVETECWLVGPCKVCGGHSYGSMSVYSYQILLQALTGKTRENLEKASLM